MTRRNFLIIAIIVVAGLGVYLYTHNKSSTNKYDNSSTEVRPTNSSITSANSTKESQITSLTSSSPSASITSTPTVSATATVKFDGNAFSPNTITIQKGETVNFQNTSKKQISIFSTTYPENTDYIPLNVGIVQQGQFSPAITFNSAGTFKYYEHSNPDKNGQIVVK